MLRIVHYPHPALRFLSKPVVRIDDTLRSQVREMFDLMYEAKGIGLAANQVALPRRFFVLNLTADPEQRDQELVFLNPVIVKRHAQTEEEEGCLSFPGLYGRVRRARTIRIQAYDLQGQPFEVEANDLLSRAIQHETDHLDGRLFIDLFDEATKNEAAPKVREFERHHQQAQASGELEDDATLLSRMHELARDDP